jgi:hypothetical protein
LGHRAGILLYHLYSVLLGCLLLPSLSRHYLASKVASSDVDQEVLEWMAMYLDGLANEFQNPLPSFCYLVRVQSFCSDSIGALKGLRRRQGPLVLQWHAMKDYRLIS